MIADINVEGKKRLLKPGTPLISCYAAVFFIIGVTGPYKVIVQAHSHLTVEGIYSGGWPG